MFTKENKGIEEYQADFYHLFGKFLDSQKDVKIQQWLRKALHSYAQSQVEAEREEFKKTIERMPIYGTHREHHLISKELLLETLNQK